MEATKIKVSDYYNVPAYYTFMPREIFEILEAAFLKGEVSTEVPKYLFDNMINDFNNEA